MTRTKKEIDKVEEELFMLQMSNFMDNDRYHKLQYELDKLKWLEKKDLIDNIEVGDLVDFGGRVLYVTRIGWIEKNRVGQPVDTDYFMTTKNAEDRTNEDAEGPVLRKTLAVRIIEKYNGGHPNEI